MWTKKIIAQTENAIRFQILENGKNLCFREVFNLWKGAIDFRSFYIHLLAECNFTAFYWEHPGLRTNLIEKPYEFVLLNSNSLDKRTLNETAFVDFFQTNQLVVNFDNLGKNARLIVPTPQGEVATYKHFGRFIRADKTAQQHALFEQIGHLTLQKIDAEKTLWLNTAGNGVIWLHIRLDSRPKYYKTRAYKNPEFLNEQVRQFL